MVVRIRSESDDMRDVMMGLKEDVQRLDALLRLVGERLTRAVEPSALLVKRDVAARLGVSVRQVDRLVARGDLPPTLRSVRRRAGNGHKLTRMWTARPRVGKASHEPSAAVGIPLAALRRARAALCARVAA